MQNGKELKAPTICPQCSKWVNEDNTHFCPLCGMQLSCPIHEEPLDVLLSSEGVSEQNIPREKPYSFAGFWIRLGAFWMDTLLLSLIAMITGSLLYSTALGHHLFPDFDKINLFLIILFIFYHALFLGTFKTTPGKKFFGLEVIPAKKPSRFGYAEAFLRTLSYYISAFFLGIGFLWIAFDKAKQGWHDKLAQTIVMKKSPIPLLKKSIVLGTMTFLVFITIALQFNLAWVYKSAFNHYQNLTGNYGKEVVSVLVTKSEIRTGVYKEIKTRTGPHTIRIPSSSHDGDVFKVNRAEEEGGVFYIRIVVIESI